MLSIILTILKIIGISILVILGIILFLLLIVGFVPVRYRGKGTYQNKAVYVEGRATWLLHAVTALAVFENEKTFHICLKIFGLRIYDNLRPAKVKPSQKNKKVKKTKNKSEDVGEIQAASISDTDDMEDTNDMDDTETVEKSVSTKKIDDCKEQDFAKNKNVFKNFFQKLRMFITKIIDFFKNITFTFHRICDTINKVLANIKYYLDLLQLERTKLAFASCKKQFLRVFNSIVPKKYRINLHLGFDDPSVMGEVLAVWGMLYPFHQGNIDIQPEFDQSIIEGDFYFKGRISIYVFVRAVCVLLFDKNFKLLIKQLKQGK